MSDEEQVECRIVTCAAMLHPHRYAWYIDGPLPSVCVMENQRIQAVATIGSVPKSEYDKCIAELEMVNCGGCGRSWNDIAVANKGHLDDCPKKGEDPPRV